MGITKFEITGTKGAWRVRHSAGQGTNTLQGKPRSRPQSQRFHMRSAKAMT